MAEICPLLGERSIHLLISFSDVGMLSSLFQSAIDPKDQTCQPLLAAASRLELDKSSSLKFFRFDIFETEPFGIIKPSIEENVIEKVADSPLSLAASTLFKFFSSLPILADSPESLKDFISYHENRSRVTSNIRSQALISYLMIKLNSVSPEDQVNIMPTLDDEMRRQSEFNSRNQQLLVQITKMESFLRSEIEKYTEHSNNCLPMMYSEIFELFIQQNSNISTLLNDNKNLYITDKPAFLQFFFPTLLNY